MRCLTLMIAVAAFVGTGCQSHEPDYDPYTFSSDAADMLLGWSPQYQIMFRAMEGNDSMVAEYTFSNPPPLDRVLVCLNFDDYSELEVLGEGGAHAFVTIFDESDTVVFAGDVSVKPLEGGWLPMHFPAVRPPAGWCRGEKGQVVLEEDELRHWRRIGEDERDRYWTIGIKGFIYRIGYTELKPGSYRVIVRIDVAAPLKCSVRVYPSLAGGFRGPPFFFNP